MKVLLYIVFVALALKHITSLIVSDLIGLKTEAMIKSGCYPLLGISHAWCYINVKIQAHRMPCFYAILCGWPMKQSLRTRKKSREI